MSAIPEQGMRPTVKRESLACHTVSHRLPVVGGDVERLHLAVELLPVPADIASSLGLVPSVATQGVLDHELFASLVAVAVAITVWCQNASGGPNLIRNAVLSHDGPGGQDN